MALLDPLQVDVLARVVQRVPGELRQPIDDVADVGERLVNEPDEAEIGGTVRVTTREQILSKPDDDEPS